MVVKLNDYRLRHVKKYVEINKQPQETDNEFLDRTASVICNDTDMLQFNQDNISTKDYIALGKKLRELCSIYDVIFVVKNRADVAKIVEADGVILEEDEISYNDVKAYLDENAIIGLLTQNNTCKFPEFDYIYPPFRKNNK